MSTFGPVMPIRTTGLICKGISKIDYMGRPCSTDFWKVDFHKFWQKFTLFSNRVPDRCRGKISKKNKKSRNKIDLE